jgi:hypothetical protein
VNVKVNTRIKRKCVISLYVISNLVPGDSESLVVNIFSSGSLLTCPSVNFSTGWMGALREYRTPGKNFAKEYNMKHTYAKEIHPNSEIRSFQSLFFERMMCKRKNNASISVTKTLYL